MDHTGQMSQDEHYLIHDVDDHMNQQHAYQHNQQAYQHSQQAYQHNQQAYQHNQQAYQHQNGTQAVYEQDGHHRDNGYQGNDLYGNQYQHHRQHHSSQHSENHSRNNNYGQRDGKYRRRKQVGHLHGEGMRSRRLRNRRYREDPHVRRHHDHQYPEEHHHLRNRTLSRRRSRKQNVVVDIDQELRRRFPGMDLERLEDMMGIESYQRLVDVLLQPKEEEPEEEREVPDVTNLEQESAEVADVPGPIVEPVDEADDDVIETQIYDSKATSVILEDSKSEGSTIQAPVKRKLLAYRDKYLPPNQEHPNGLMVPGRPSARADYERKHNKTEEGPANLKGFQNWRHGLKLSFTEKKKQLKSFFIDFEFWKGSLKEIEGSFGSSVASYFRFLRWLMFLNLLIALLIVAIIILPQELLGTDHFNKTLYIHNDNSEDLMNPYYEQSLSCSQMYSDTLQDSLDGQSVGYIILDLFQGTGWLENKVLFYGYYFNRTGTSSTGEVDMQYNMSVAYLVCTLAYFLLSLFAMVAYTTSRMNTRGSSGIYHHFNQVFCGWDFSLTTKKAIEYKHKSLNQQFTNDCLEERLKETWSAMGFLGRFKVYAFRVFAHLVVLIFWGGAGFTIITVINVSVELTGRDDVTEGTFVYLLIQFLPSLTITGLNMIIPLVFDALVKKESYSPQGAIKMTLFRTVFLRLASVMVLVVTLREKIVSCDNRECGSCPDTVGLCWETFVGQEFYRLVVLDFIVVVVGFIFVKFPRKWIVSRYLGHADSSSLQPDDDVPKRQHADAFGLCKKIGIQEFQLPENVLDLVYTQTLCWLGAFFSPLIPAITVLKLFVYFYVKKVTLLRFSKLPESPYRASAEIFFVAILMFSFVFCVLPVVYIIGRVSPSQSCGAFRLHTRSEYTLFDGIQDSLSRTPDALQDIFNILGSWALYVPTVVVTFLLIYYYFAMISGSKRMVGIMRKQLRILSNDGQYYNGQLKDVMRRINISQPANVNLRSA